MLPQSADDNNQYDHDVDCEERVWEEEMEDGDADSKHV